MRGVGYLVGVLLLAGCARQPVETVRFGGQAMGTSYSVIYEAASGTALAQAQVDSLLDALNMSLSTYVDSSIISRVNASADTTRWFDLDVHFARVMDRSYELHERSGGALNPALGPLIDAWGFGVEGPGEPPSDEEITQLLMTVDFRSFSYDASRSALKKGEPAASLNFNAIAKGYGVDIVGELLEANGITDYFVEIGGEVRTRGLHPEGRSWRVGIERPAANMLDGQTAQEVVILDNASMATSGNYRNYFERDGKRFTHILDSSTGRSKTTTMLSASVIAPDCMTADAWATAFVVMGPEAAMALVEADSSLEAYFILGGDGEAYDIQMSSGMVSFLTD